jgi:hypothetical protein
MEADASNDRDATRGTERADASKDRDAARGGNDGHASASAKAEQETARGRP